MRGRVLAIDRETFTAVVRGERIDARVPADPRWRPGDIVDHDGTIVGTFAAAGASRDGIGTAAPRNDRSEPDVEFPAPSTETARLTRARMANLHARARALATVRTVFAERDFVEVETPLLVKSPGLEIHLDAVPAGDGGYLITSPEYQMKRLLAGGFERIYQVCKCFRGNEHGPHHAGEFTMIEWYRAFADLDAIVDDTEQLVARVVHAVTGSAFARGGGRAIDVTPPWPRATVRTLMREHAGVEVRGDEPAAELRAAVAAAGIDVDERAAWDDAFFAAFLARVEPAIAALDRPIIVEDWPAPLAALARKKPGDPLTALRFEAYAGGLELATAFGELVDPVEQRARFEDDLRIRRERGRAVYPLDERLLAALAEGLPPAAGIALGFDRLVMLATGADDIAGVLTFTADEL